MYCKGIKNESENPMSSNIVSIQNEIKKFEDIIRRNPNSPLLVRLAWLYLEIGDVEKAISLCSKAIEKYPNYSTAHLVMAKCYLELKFFSKALEELNNVIEILPDSKFVIDLISKISPKQKREEPTKKKTRQKIEEGLPELEISTATEQKKAKHEQLSSFYDEEFELPTIEHEEKIAVDEDKSFVQTQASYLDELIKRLEAGKTERNKVEAKEPKEEVKFEEELSYDNISIVTPALAEILVKQGAYEEAIKVYKKLIEQRPFEKEKFEQEIKKLEEKITK